MILLLINFSKIIQHIRSKIFNFQFLKFGMKLRTRYVIIFIFFVIFFVSATVLLKYAVGYRYNFKKNSWQKTGVLVIESVPKNASIFLNGELQEEKTPAKIMNLFPGDYSVKLQKTNFYDWEKNITIDPNLTTFVQNVALFKKNQTPVLLSDKIIEFSKLFPNKKEMIFFVKSKTGFNLWLFNFDAKEEKFLASFSLNQLTQINNIFFNDSEKKILIEGNNILGKINYLVLNIEKPKEIIVLNELIPNIQKVKWHIQNDKILYGVVEAKNQSSIVQINLKDKKITPVVFETMNILDYFVNEKFIYYLTLNSENNIFLKQANKKDYLSVNKKITQLPHSNYSFESSMHNILAILDKKNQLLYLISPQSEINLKTQELILEAKDMSWSKDGGKILYYNDSELWICYLNQEKLKESFQKLLSRWEQEILKAVWFPQENYLMYNLSGLIKAIEVDGYDQKDIIYFLKSENIKDLFFSSRDKFFYFIKNGKLFEMEIN